MADAPNYLTAAEAAEVLRCTPIHVSRLCTQGKIPATRPFGTWLIERADLDALLVAGRNGGTDDTSEAVAS